MHYKKHTPHHPHLFPLFFLSLVVCVFSWSYAADFAVTKRITGTLGSNVLSWGIFFTTTGNGGQINFYESGFPPAPVTPFPNDGAFIEVDGAANNLSGTIHIQSVGLATFYDAKLIEPAGTANNILDNWTVTGYLWSPNAGWIELQPNWGTSASGVSYIPATQSFTGYAWNPNIGVIDFGKTDGLEEGLIGKVKIIGNIAGGKSYDVLYSLGSKFNSVTFTTFINNIRRNVALLTRNVPATLVNTSENPSGGLKTLNNILIYKLAGNNVHSNTFASIIASKNIQTVIIEGGNLILDGDIAPFPGGQKPRAIIVKKDEAGNGGDVYIKANVTEIKSSLIAEGSLYSGDDGSLYNDTKAKVTNLPINQLYIYGALISRNTIGGSAFSSNVSCPYTENDCNRDTAIKYDLNYFRTFLPSQGGRGYKDPSLDAYSVIIEHDPRAISTPPPGMTAP